MIEYICGDITSPNKKNKDGNLIFMLIRKLTKFIESDKIVEKWNIHKINSSQFFTFRIEKKYDVSFIYFKDRMFSIDKYDVLHFVTSFIDTLKNDDVQHWKQYYSLYLKELAIFLLNYFTSKQLLNIIFKNNVIDNVTYNSFYASIKNNDTLIDKIDDATNLLLFYNSFLK